MRTNLIVVLGCLSIAISCVDADDRCGDYEWNPAKRACHIPDDTVASGNDTESDSDLTPQMAAPCDADADCAQYNTDYCLIVAPDPGFCTLKNCTSLPNGCPTGYVCCVSVFTNMFVDHCMPEDAFDELGGTLCAH